MAWEKGKFWILDDQDNDLVCHAVGTSEQKASSYGAKSWLDYWKKIVKENNLKENNLKDGLPNLPNQCQILGCGGPVEVGAHVYLKRSQQTFILPTCRPCNTDKINEFCGRDTDWVSTKKNAIIVWVERAEATYPDDDD